MNDAGLDRDVPFVPWAEFEPDFLEAWRANVKGQAQHVTLVGPNGQGKTHLALRLIQARSRARKTHSVIMATKPQDRELSALGREPDWTITREWPPGYGVRNVIYWPKFGNVRTATTRQRAAFAPVLEDIFEDGNRLVYFDEALYFTQGLRLDDIMVQYWQMGRSQNVIVVAGTQRPRNVPRAMFSECSWFIAFRTADDDELKRVSEIGGADTKTIRDVMRRLEPHEFVAVQTRTGVMVRSKANA